MKDIRQRDMEYVTRSEWDSIQEGIATDRIVTPPSVVMQTGNKMGLGIALFVLILFVGSILLIGFSAKIMYDEGYKQAKIDYHIKP